MKGSGLRISSDADNSPPVSCFVTSLLNRPTHLRAGGTFHAIRVSLDAPGSIQVPIGENDTKGRLRSQGDGTPSAEHLQRVPEEALRPAEEVCDPHKRQEGYELSCGCGCGGIGQGSTFA